MQTLGVKDLLEKLKKNYRTINILLIQREKVFASVTNKSREWTGMPESKEIKDRVTDAIVKLNELTDKWYLRVQEYEAMQKAAEKIYEQLEPKYANALRCRYSLDMTWNETAKYCNYSIRSVQEFCRRGIWIAEEKNPFGIKVCAQLRIKV